MSNAVMNRAYGLWHRDPAAALIYARRHSSKLPNDLLQQVAARDALVRRQSERMREAREMNDRINTFMQGMGGAATHGGFGVPMISGDPARNTFETMLAIALTAPPTAAVSDAPQCAVVEGYLAGRLREDDFLAAILPPLAHQQLAASRLALQLVPMLSPHMVWLQAFPRILAAVLLPQDRVGAVATAMGLR